ncbi:hypothetical protein P7K49_014314 [Saguinus oedipus]|uniref:Uncharacterized protein n=1 Tax=Saguinus oedipus TaxID=9490 RepID=A0ABQ9VJV1_SAGOE|nr:hypothetical protein P7K49_014314 [Saguinus oedipus]
MEWLGLLVKGWLHQRRPGQTQLLLAKLPQQLQSCRSQESSLKDAGATGHALLHTELTPTAPGLGPHPPPTIVIIIPESSTESGSGVHHPPDAQPTAFPAAQDINGAPASVKWEDGSSIETKVVLTQKRQPSGTDDMAGDPMSAPGSELQGSNPHTNQG